MIKIRKAGDRGRTAIDWLDSRHSFSFGHYMDPAHMGFRALRVINEDRVAPGAGFPPHGHRDMEILTYVLDGALRHQDSLGHGSVIARGDVQVMSAGTGIRHSEFNASDEAPVHFLQIWLLPERAGLAPRYAQERVDIDGAPGRLHRVAARQGGDGAVQMFQDVVLHAGVLRAGDAVETTLAPGRHAWIQVVRGEIDAGGAQLSAGDGAAVSDMERIALRAQTDAEVLVFDLA